MLFNRGPLAAAVLGAGMLMILTAMMLQMRRAADKGPAETLLPRDPGRSFFSEAELRPFLEARYTGAKTLAELQPALGALLERLRRSNRDTMAAYLDLQEDWRAVCAAPTRWTGVMFPLHPARAALAAAPDGPDGSTWLDVELPGAGSLRLLVLLAGRDLPAGARFYLDAVYLGQARDGERLVHLGLARELFILPGDGRFPVCASDEEAFDEVMDDMVADPAIAAEVRAGSRTAFLHLLGKVQRGQYDGPAGRVGYEELMDKPERWRGRSVSFTGSLIHLQRRRLGGPDVVPGMECFYEGHVLDADRILYVFRSLELPAGLRLRDVVRLEGPFLQRYNFPNRAGTLAWAPLLVAARVQEVEEPGYRSTPGERRLIGGAIAAVFLAVGWVVWRDIRSRHAPPPPRPAPKAPLVLRAEAPPGNLPGRKGPPSPPGNPGNTVHDDPST